MTNSLRKYLRAVVSGGKNKRRSTEILGYDAAQLAAHIERQFTRGMSWDCFMRGEIHIDHILPKTLFPFSGIDDPNFRACWALSNLRPMWKPDNLKKHTKREVLL
jgi:hypothetical protein